MAIGHVVTRGYGNGTFTGNIGEVVTRGYTPDSIVVPSVEGIEFTLPADKMHFTLPDDRLEFTLPADKLHFTMGED